MGERRDEGQIPMYKYIWKKGRGKENIAWPIIGGIAFLWEGEGERGKFS